MLFFSIIACSVLMALVYVFFFSNADFQRMTEGTPGDELEVVATMDGCLGHVRSHQHGIAFGQKMGLKAQSTSSSRQ